MIELKTIDYVRIPLYDNEDVLLGYVNEYELLNAQIQICQQSLEGYYVLLNDNKLVIDRYGMFASKLRQYPFDNNLREELLMCGVNIRKQQRSKCEKNT